MPPIPIIWQPRYTLTSAMARGLMEIEAARACGLSAIYRHMQLDRYLTDA